MCALNIRTPDQQTTCAPNRTCHNLVDLFYQPTKWRSVKPEKNIHTPNIHIQYVQYIHSFGCIDEVSVDSESERE